MEIQIAIENTPDFTPELSLFIGALETEPVGLAAKWAPSEGGRFNHFAKMFRRELKMSPKQYRKFLSAERERLRLVEIDLCSHKVDQINFSHIPSQAMLKYRDAFGRSTNAKDVELAHREELSQRFKTYLEQVKSGEAKINSGTLMPHQLVSGLQSEDSTRDALWNSMVQSIKDKSHGFLSKSIAIVDVSSSMNCNVAEGVQAMDIAVALGMIIAEVSFVANKRVITFSAKPSLFTIPDGTLYQKVAHVKSMEWGGNTNFFATFKMLIQQRIPAEKLFVFSDMQFDSASGGYNTSLHDQLKAEYDAVGMTMPQLIYWNLNASKTALPITISEEGHALVSGFSKNLLDVFMTDTPFDPLTIVQKSLAKYNVTLDANQCGSKSCTIDWDAVKKATTHPQKIKKDADEATQEDEEYR